MTISKLEKAAIVVLDGSRKDEVIHVLFNPTSYSVDRANTYKATPVAGLISPLIQFINGEADQLSMELLLDDYTDRNGPVTSTAASGGTVLQRLRAISALLNVDASLHAPPPVKFVWGPFEFAGVIEKLSRKVTMFHADGSPARATLSVAFKEYRTLTDQLQQPRLESSDKSKRRVIVGLDSLWAMAAREYGDPARWRLIAAANDLDDPREIVSGQWLVVPPEEEQVGTRTSI